MGCGTDHGRRRMVPENVCRAARRCRQVHHTLHRSGIRTIGSMGKRHKSVLQRLQLHPIQARHHPLSEHPRHSQPDSRKGRKQRKQQPLVYRLRTFPECMAHHDRQAPSRPVGHIHRRIADRRQKGGCQLLDNDSQQESAGRTRRNPPADTRPGGKGSLLHPDKHGNARFRHGPSPLFPASSATLVSRQSAAVHGRNHAERRRKGTRQAEYPLRHTHPGVFRPKGIPAQRQAA